jgi:hypothetical protein
MAVTLTDVNTKTMHAISVYLLKVEDLRDDKLNSLLENKETSFKIKNGEINWTILGEGIVATTKIPKSKEWQSGKLICKIETDYFGGFGDQSAKLYRDNNILIDEDTRTDQTTNPINQALKMMGVKAKPGMDEFDTVGLGRYRTNEDFK